MPTLEYVKCRIDLDPNIAPDKSFSACHKKFLEYKKDNTMGSTYDDHKTLETTLERFEKETKIKINFDNINSETIEKFKKHLIKRENSQFTVKKRLKQLRTVLNWAVENNISSLMIQQYLNIKPEKAKETKFI